MRKNGEMVMKGTKQVKCLTDELGKNRKKKSYLKQRTEK